MQITSEIRGKYLVVRASGRLDVSWAEHFAETLLTHVRHGHHHLLVDASEIVFLSSAGIRSLMRIYKELLTVKGSFFVIKPTTFVKNTLETSGLSMLLASDYPEDFPSSSSSGEMSGGTSGELYVLKENAVLELSIPADWKPWQSVKSGMAVDLEFPPETFALGIGCPSEDVGSLTNSFGEFLAVHGNVVYQPPNEDSRPDYLLGEKNFVPRMTAIQALVCKGELSHLFRFSPDEKKFTYELDELLQIVLKSTKSTFAGFVILGEVEGLVGSALIKSPGLMEKEFDGSYPEVCNWLSFSGERVHSGQQALVFGLVSSSPEGKRIINQNENDEDLAIHAHASVFPYRPLQNGKIDLKTNLERFFNGPPPLALFHLVNDSRSGSGIGQSSFIRGACWCAPVKSMEGIV